MKVKTEVELTINGKQKYMLWGIMHHHVQNPDLDPYEEEFVAELLHTLDPRKEYEEKYIEVQARKG